MPAIYQASIDLAAEMIERKGLPGLLIKTPATVDEGQDEAPWRADFTDQTDPGELDEAEKHDIHAILKPLKRAPGDASFQDGLAILTDHKTITIAAKGLTVRPEPGDVCRFGADDWTVVGVTTIEPNGTPIIFNATARRA